MMIGKNDSTLKRTHFCHEHVVTEAAICIPERESGKEHNVEWAVKTQNIIRIAHAWAQNLFLSVY